MSEQKIISFDSTILNTFQACERKTKLSFVDNLKPNIKSESLEEGDLFHKMLEVYYGLKHGLARIDSDLWKVLREAGIFDEQWFINPPEDLLTICNFVGDFFAGQMDAPPDELDEVKFQFNAYSEFYKHDEWHPLAVEEVGSKVLFEDEDWKIIYNAKTDLIAEKGSRIVPWDHKTGRRRQTPSSLANQFIGTCFILDLNFIMINKIGFQKSLSASERFQRFLLQIQESRIKEWVENTIIWGKRIYYAQAEDLWPMNLTSCDKYSGCVYRPICEAPVENRLYQIERDFVEGDKWDVARVLEA